MVDSDILWLRLTVFLFQISHLYDGIACNAD